MNLFFSKKADKSYQKLSSKLQKKADKQFMLLLDNYRHPSLRTSKMGSGDYEGRIDYHNRFTFSISGEEITILTVGPHDEGLGKK